MGGRSGDVMIILGLRPGEKSRSVGPKRLSVSLPDGSNTLTGILRGVKVPERQYQSRGIGLAPKLEHTG